MKKPLSEKIYELRIAKGLTQERFSEMLDVSAQAVSKWEQGKSLPNTTMLPKICAVFGMSVDDFLEIPTIVDKASCMEGLASYAKGTDGLQAIFESFKTCVAAVDNDLLNGSALQSCKGIRICISKGIGIIIDGREQIDALLQVDAGFIQQICSFLSDKNVMKIIRALDFTVASPDSEIARKCGLPKDDVISVLYQLIKLGYCECDSVGRYRFGQRAYAVFAVLCGLYVASPDGLNKVNSFTNNIPPKV